MLPPAAYEAVCCSRRTVVVARIAASQTAYFKYRFCQCGAKNAVGLWLWSRSFQQRPDTRIALCVKDCSHTDSLLCYAKNHDLSAFREYIGDAKMAPGELHAT